MHLRLDDDDGGEDNDGFLGGGGVPGVPGAASTSYGGGSGGEAGAPLLCEDEDDGPVLALLAQVIARSTPRACAHRFLPSRVAMHRARCAVVRRVFNLMTRTFLRLCSAERRKSRARGATRGPPS